MPSKNYTLFFIFSVGFVLISIAFITILGQTSNKDGSSSDIRAKATVANSLKLVGTVSTINTETKTVTVENIAFDGSDPQAKSMGTFTVTAPSDVSVSTFSPGQAVFIAADAATFNTATKTMTALQMSPR